MTPQPMPFVSQYSDYECDICGRKFPAKEIDRHDICPECEDIQNNEED